MINQKFYIGQQLKNSIEDNFPMFVITEITTLKTTGAVYYRVEVIGDSENTFILHEEDLIPFEETAQIVVSDDVKAFEEGKKYIFSPSKIQVPEINKWINHIVDNVVKVQLEGLGFIIVNHPRKGLKEYPIYPKFCKEII
ncbi:hypothetical protein [Lysinibacillus sp. NPDC086135]|uniref:hypothetical protein n=1 Tax=Lysinibacillus sp. NPDC086135 TaxID=3364130 RepID=UPI003817951E